MLPYILKATFCLVLLLGFYHLVLEKEKMHNFNRFYLLGSILFSFIVPSFIITVAPEIIETPVFTDTSTLEQFSTEALPLQVTETTNYTQYIIGLYILVSSILFILLSRKVYGLLHKAKQNQHINYFSATVVLLKERIVPYTFLQYIFINKFTYQTDSLEEQILTHELAHVEQKHSIDVLFIEVLQNLFWFNPIFRYYKKAIQLNHEFLADDAVINSHKNITEYQQVLLNTTAQNNNIYLASNLNYSLTKKRLLMMTKPSSKTKILLKKLMVAPLVAGFVFAFAQRVEAQENKDKPQVVEVKVNEKGISDKEMNEYKELITKAKRSRIFIYKQLTRMKELYNKMSTNQQNSVEDVYELAPQLPPISHKKKTPTTAQLKSWKNKKKFALWIDGKVIDNKVLDKYKNTDFSYFIGSKAHKNARSKSFPQEYQFNLYTNSFFTKMKEREKKENKNIIRIFINKEGGLLVNGKVTSIHKLKNVLSKIDIDKTNALVVINSDKNTKTRDITKVKEILRESKLYKIIFNLKLLPPPPPKPQVIEVVAQQKTRFHKNHFITIDGQKYYYTFDKNERIARYYKNGKLVKLNIVKEYGKKHKIFKRLKNTGKHYVFKSKKEQKVIDREFSDLGGMYFRMPRRDKNKVSRPDHPSKPYVTLWKNGEKFYKKKGELSNEDRLLMMPPPPPPNASKKELKKFKESMKAWRKRTGQLIQVREVKPVKIEVIEKKKKNKKTSKPQIREVKPVSIKVVEKVNSKELTEIIEEEVEVVEQHELREVEEKEVKELIEVKEILETQEVVELIEVTETPIVEELVEVKELMEVIQEEPISVKNVPVEKSMLQHVKSLIKKGAKFTYNKKKISSRKAIQLIKANHRLPMYSVINKKNKSIEVHFSDTPYVKEIIKKKN